MLVSELNFDYPEKLVATSPSRPTRVMWTCDIAGRNPKELNINQLLDLIPPGDTLVINNTKVLKRRIFADNLEILFLDKLDALTWQVLFPSKKFKIGDEILIPGGFKMTLLEKGRPQVVKFSKELSEDYFLEYGELPLPPYIQQARDERHNVSQDESWYQTNWGDKPGSFAAPTASLHFKNEDLDFLRKKGVEILQVTLHVGLGTFLPVTAEKLEDHKMHPEYIEITRETIDRLKQAKNVWALGTTAMRTIESVFSEKLISISESSSDSNKSSALTTSETIEYTASNSINLNSLKEDVSENNQVIRGHTDIMITPGYQFKRVNYLLTNFHQPQSTLLALVAAFVGLDKVKNYYTWAIENKFKLFSYGDLCVFKQMDQSK